MTDRFLSGHEIAGVAQEGWGPLADAFARNFELFGGQSAAVAVYHRGAKVVDLWSGRNARTGRPMQPDTLMSVASCSKGITATVLGVLIERGFIDPSKLVVDYWPEYGASGKQATTMAMVASHRAGLPYPPLGNGLTGLDYFAGTALARTLARANPLWPPGEAMAYHPSTAGSILDEVVRRATGSTISEHLRRHIAEPLNLSMWIGLPVDEVRRVEFGSWADSDITMPPEQVAPPGSYADLRVRALAEAAPFEPDREDLAEVHAYLSAERPAVGAVTDARSLARMYASTVGEVDGIRLFSETTRQRLVEPQTDAVETLIESGTAGPDIRFGLGYQLPSGSMRGFGPASFGHTGAGGRLGLADPDLEVGFGYICSSMRNIGPSGDPRWEGLLKATARCAG